MKATDDMPEGRDDNDEFGNPDPGPTTPDGVTPAATPSASPKPRRRRPKTEPPAPTPEPAQVVFEPEPYFEPPTQQELEEEAARRAQAQRDLDAQPWFQKHLAKPTQTWYVRRDGPAKGKGGKRVQTGICREPIRGKLTIDKISALMGGGSMSVTSDDPVGPNPPTWYPLDELLGEPINFDVLDGGSSPSADAIDAEIAKLGDAMGMPAAPADPEVEVYDPILKETIKVRKSLAADVQRKNQPPAPPREDSKLLDFLKEQQKRQEETSAVILRALTALLEKPSQAPSPPALTGDNPYKDMLALEQSRNDRALADLRAQILAMQNQPRPAGGDPMAMIGHILGAAKDLAGLSGSGAGPGSTALSAIDKIVGRTADALGTMWPSIAGPFNAALWNIAWTAPFGGMPPGGIPAQPTAPQITGPTAAGASPTPVPAPPVTTPQEQERMFSGIKQAVDKIGLMLDGKVTPEDAWATIRAVAPPAVIAQVQALASPAHVEVALTNLAMMPFMESQRDALLQQAKRATGDAKAIAERFVAIGRKG